MSDVSNLMTNLWSVAVQSLVAPGSGCRRGSVVQEERAQGQDADSTQGGGDQDGEHRRGQDLSPHVLPLVLPVLDAVIKEHGAQSS